MKTIISLIVCLFMFVGVQGQTKTARMATGNSFIDLAFSASDSVAAGQTVYTVTIDAAQHFPTTQDLLIKLDSIDAPGATVDFQGSKFGTTYAAIGSQIAWAGLSADTTIIISNATLNRYRFYKVIVTRTAGKALISDAKLKLYFE